MQTINQACRVAEDFTKVYYETVDKRRHLLFRFYHENATLVWNGNGTKGTERIQKFFNDLPSSIHSVTTMDAQPKLDSTMGNQVNVLIQVSGTVKYHNKDTIPFLQNFMINVQGNKWKILSDSFRLQEQIQEQKSF